MIMLNNLMFFVGKPINWTTFGIAVAIICGVALLMGVCIMLISKLCAVEEDPRIAEVEGCLAGANCGACGFAGCSGFAKALVYGTASLDACGLTSAQGKIEIGNILGIAVGGTEPTICVVACNGSNIVAITCQSACNLDIFDMSAFTNIAKKSKSCCTCIIDCQSIAIK